MADGDDPGLGATVRGLAAGQRVFQRYRLERVLGRGGMGVVWLALDEELERKVALKFVPELVCLDKEAIADLKRETRRSLEITHANIVRIHDFHQDGQTAAISMEYIEGKTLSELKVERKGCIGVSELKPIVKQLCEALDYAHGDARVVHRDLKPANLMLDSRGRLKITDFGISCSISDSVSRMSMARGSGGTAVFMSPQQALGGRPTAADDIYSLGATIYDLLSGKPPFYRGDLMTQLREAEPAAMTARRRELDLKGEAIPEAWESAVRACLAKDPAARPKTAGELLEALEDRPAGEAVWMGKGASTFKNQDATSAAQGSQGHAERRVRQRRSALIAAAAGLVGIAAVVWWLGPGRTAMLERRARAGEATAQYEMGVAVLDGGDGPKDPSKAAEWFLQAAQQGHAGAQNALGELYRFGRGVVSRDFSEALKWIRMAVEQGHANAQANLGDLYRFGLGVEADASQAVKWYRLSAEQGDADGMNRLGHCYRDGRGVAKDHAKAAELYARAMAKGSWKGMINLGFRYLQGEGVEKDIAKGIALIREASARDDPAAWNVRGNMYQQGLGVETNLTEAVAWYRKAADAGDMDALSNLGRMYEKGQGVPMDDAKAVECYRKAVDAGGSVALTTLALRHLQGRGVQRDEAKAVELYEKAVNAGHSGAMHSLGRRYLEGTGVQRNDAKAFELFQRAADAGHSGAMNDLGWMSADGRGVQRDEAKALQWYQKAAERGSARGWANLGFAYLNGRGVERDPARGLECVKKAAEMGDTWAQALLQGKK